MNTTLTPEQQSILEQIQETAPYFMEYMSDTVRKIILWELPVFSLKYSWTQIWWLDEAYEKACIDSRVKDESYRSGDMGRLAIAEPVPNDIQFFIPQRDRCLEILDAYLL